MLRPYDVIECIEFIDIVAMMATMPAARHSIPDVAPKVRSRRI